MVAVTEAAWTAIGAGIGAGAVLLATAIEKVPIGQKRRWEDELLKVASGFVAAARRLETIAVRLGGDPEETRHPTGEESSETALAKAEDQLFVLRDLYPQIQLLAPIKAQRAARLVIEHAWQTLQVFGYGQPDQRAEFYSGRPVAKRLRQERDTFVKEVRGSLRVRRRWRVFTEDDLERERRARGAPE